MAETPKSGRFGSIGAESRNGVIRLRTGGKGHRPMSKRARRKIHDVALLIETTRSYGRNVLRGVGDYARVYGPWLFHMPAETPIRAVPTAEEWDGDGIIAQPRQNMEFWKELAESGIPVVSLSGPPGTFGLPAVRANQEAVAELAMSHFRDRGFMRFAYCGVPSEKIWPPTGEYFAGLAQRQGFSCEIYQAAYEVK